MAVRLSLLLLVAVAGASTDSGALRGFFSDPGHTVDPSLIPGVTNDAGAAATRIALPAAGLTGSLSPAIGRLPALRELSLPENRLSGVLPQELYLGGASIPSRSFAVATNLLILSLSNNNFSGSIPSFICNLTHLVILDLSNSNFFGELPNCWQKSGVERTRDEAGEEIAGEGEVFEVGEAGRKQRSPVRRLEERSRERRLERDASSRGTTPERRLERKSRMRRARQRASSRGRTPERRLSGKESSRRAGRRPMAAEREPLRPAAGRATRVAAPPAS